MSEPFVTFATARELRMIALQPVSVRGLDTWNRLIVKRSVARRAAYRSDKILAARRDGGMIPTEQSGKRQRPTHYHGINAPPIGGSDFAIRDDMAAASNALLRRQLVYGQHGYTDPEAYGRACRLAGLPA